MQAGSIAIVWSRLLNALPVRVNKNETTGVKGVFPSEGGRLIQTWEGSSGGWGGLRTKRSG